MYWVRFGMVLDLQHGLGKVWYGAVDLHHVLGKVWYGAVDLHHVLGKVWYGAEPPTSC